LTCSLSIIDMCSLWDQRNTSRLAVVVSITIIFTKSSEWWWPRLAQWCHLANETKLITSISVSTWIGDQQWRPGAVNLGPFFGVNFELWPIVYKLTIDWIHSFSRLIDCSAIWSRHVDLQANIDFLASSDMRCVLFPCVGWCCYSVFIPWVTLDWECKTNTVTVPSPMTSLSYLS